MSGDTSDLFHHEKVNWGLEQNDPTWGTTATRRQFAQRNQFLTTSCWNYLKTTVWLMTLFKSLKTRNPKMPLSTTCSTQQMVVSGCRPFGYRWGAAPWRNDPKHRQETQLGTAAVTRWSVNFTPGGDDLHSTSTCGLRISSRWIVFGHDIPAARH